MKIRSTRTLTIIFVLLAGVNLLLFYFREDFAYVPYANYESLYKSCEENCQEKWGRFITPYHPNELSEARKILATQTNIKSIASTIDKVLSIASFEYSKFHEQMGKPSDALAGLSPMQQFQKVSVAKTEKLWCGNLAAIFAFFCLSERIVCRYIELFNPGDHHVVNECFIPELNQWVMVDVTTNNLLLQDKKLRYLNLQQVINRVINKEVIYTYRWMDGLPSRIALNINDAAITNYYGKKNPLYYFSSLISKTTYSPSEKIKRYFLPVSWYDVYDENSGTNLPYYIKIIFFLAWVFIGIFLTSLFLQNRNHD